MRVISGFVAAAILAALSQSAWALCINRGGAVTCREDDKYWEPSVAPEKDPAANALPGSVKMVVLQPSGPNGNAWVVTTPQSGDAAVTQTSATAGAPACELGWTC